MNDFQSITSGSGILKNDYTATNAMKEVLKRRKQKLIDQGSVAPQDEYNSKDPEEADSD